VRAAELGVEVVVVDDLNAPPLTPVDDIVLLAPNPELIEKVSPHLAWLGVCALIGDRPMTRRVNADLGRIHYNRWGYVGGTGPDIAAAYRMCPSAPACGQAVWPGSWDVG
jgi:hypothetical protein